MPLLSYLLATAFFEGAVGVEVRIHSASELIELSNNINISQDFSGTTIFLESDIVFTQELSQQFNPIGSDIFHIFRGTFDGQGHTISGLTIDSSSQYVGLFGYSEGTAIRNVILDSSCSVTGSYNSGYAKIGGILGYCDAWSNSWIENNVNMASVAYNNDNVNSTSYLGGIIGEFSSSSYYRSKVSVKNCVNYGPVTHSGQSSDSYIGGLIGYFFGRIGDSYVRNCLNYGTITYKGTTAYKLYMGGIVGYSTRSDFDNCVSFGSISLSGTSEYNYIGGIAGDFYSSTLSNCYWVEGIKYNVSSYLYGSQISESSKFNSNFVLNESVSVGNYKGTSLIEALNAAADYYTLRDYSRWTLNKNGKDMTFKVNGGNGFKLNSKIVLLPNLAIGGRLWFDGWYKDSVCTTKFGDNEISTNTELHGKYEENSREYTITFDTRGGSSIEPMKSQFGSTILLQNSTKTNCKFLFWETEYGEKMPQEYTVLAHDITFYAFWQCTHIKTVDDFIAFSKLVNSGERYRDMIVFLDSDIDLSGKTFEHIGKNYDNNFLGTFDGQGHTIKNLVIDSSSLNVGLFGYSDGTTIKNLVLDSSCLITSSYSNSNSGTSPSVGGIIGYCYVRYNSCIVENCVNKGSVSFSGSASELDLYLGGIAGYMSSYNNDISIKNSANYGTVTQSGKTRYSYIGSIVGGVKDSRLNNGVICNCLNYGTITHKGTTTDYLYMGGIIGKGEGSEIDNCVSLGNFTFNGTTFNKYIGGIGGNIIKSSISHCYWDEGVSSGIYGLIDSSKFNSEFVLNESVSVGNYKGTSLIEALNAAADYYTLRDYSRWTLNKNGKDMTFKVNGGNGFKLNSKIVLLPNLAIGWRVWFDGWYKDSVCTTKFGDNEISSNTELYGKYEENSREYTITFDTKGGSSIEPIKSSFGTTVPLPNNVVKDNCTMTFWETEYGDMMPPNYTVLAHDITLYAVWQCTHIKTLDDLIDFSKLVSLGGGYRGKTVFLDSDIDFSGKTFEPIGTDSDHYFRGTFDGQGHTIKNLVIKSYSSRVGLFGHSKGTTIRNVVLDSSCSITGTYSSCIGGIIGYCEAYYSSCIIENCVNKGNVSFTGNSGIFSVDLGGIAGRLEGRYDYNCTVKGCTNNGTVTYNGTVTDSGGGSNSPNIGGIVGYSSGDVSLNNLIQNCVNNGEIIQKNFEKDNPFVDEIVGYSDYTDIEGCMGNGKLVIIEPVRSDASGFHLLSAVWLILLMLLMN